MKKKIILALLVVAMSIMAMAGCSSTANQGNTDNGSDDDSEKTELANPWTETDKQGVIDATGFEMTAPNGATEVSYSYMNDDGLAQMTYVLDNVKWTYRMQSANELTDISGMTYKWTTEEKGNVADKEAVFYTYSAPDSGEEDDIQVVNWYDAVPGVTYSLSASAKDLDAVDIQACAENLYTPLQKDATGDTEVDSENELEDHFIGEHKRSDDESTITISDNNDGTFKIDIRITKLCLLENGVGTFSDHKMTFEVEDPNGEKLTGVIYRDSDDSLTLKITDSTWTYLQNDEAFEGFGK